MCVLASSIPLCIAKFGFQGPPWALNSRARFPQDLPERPRAPNMLPQDLPESSCGPNMCPKTPQNAPPRLPSTSWDFRNGQGRPSKYHGNISIWPPRNKEKHAFCIFARALDPSQALPSSCARPLEPSPLAPNDVPKRIQEPPRDPQGAKTTIFS